MRHKCHTVGLNRLKKYFFIKKIVTLQIYFCSKIGVNSIRILINIFYEDNWQDKHQIELVPKPKYGHERLMRPPYIKLVIVKQTTKV